MNTANTETKPAHADRMLTELVDQIDAAATSASLATDLNYPAEVIRELEEAHRLLRLAAERVAQARRRARDGASVA